MNSESEREYRYSLCDASGVDEHIDAPIVVHNVLDGACDCQFVCDIGGIESNIYAGLLTQFASCELAGFLLDVEDGNAMDAGFGKSLCHVVAQTTTATV